jgi:membrane protease YdiL (CAAX protease family)
MSWTLHSLVRRWEANTISDRPRLELVSAFLIAPLLEEAIFRVGFCRLVGGLPGGRWSAALGSAALFSAMHQRFGRWFVGYTFAGGLVLWATYARTGYWGAVLLHVGANLLDLSIGWRRYLYTGNRTPDFGSLSDRQTRETG